MAGSKTLVPILTRLVPSGYLGKGLNTGGILSEFYGKHKLHTLRTSDNEHMYLMYLSRNK